MTEVFLISYREFFHKRYGICRLVTTNSGEQRFILESDIRVNEQPVQFGSYGAAKEWLDKEVEDEGYYSIEKYFIQA